MKFPFRTLVIAGLAVPFALAARAEPPPRAEAPAMAGHEHHMSAEQMAAHLRAVLQLRPDQEGALQTLAAAMKPPEGANHDMGSAGPEGMEHDQGLTTPQRLDRMQAHMNRMHEHMAAHVAAIKTFYAQLSPTQQKAFDAIAPMMMHHHMMMMHHGGMHGG